MHGHHHKMRCRTPGGYGPRGMGWEAAFGRPGPPRGGRGGRARRGDVRTALLMLLAEGPSNGYGLMQEIGERSQGVWRPGSGSVYPTLAQLEDEGLVRSVESDGRKFELTDAGREAVAERGEDRPAPWEEAAGDVDDDERALGQSMKQLAAAFAQVYRAGDAAQRTAAREVLDDARRSLYGLLAGDAPKGDA